MTETYDPYENAMAERINGILKQEFLFGANIIDLNTMSKLINNSVNIYNT